MSLNSTPNGERVHIGIFGKRNAGKSSLINAITAQKLSIVSDTAGTTTDPVSKAMEILPLGPVLLTDTPGFDDEGDLGKLRVKKSYEVLRNVDIAVFVISVSDGISAEEDIFIEEIKKRNLPYIICINKIDIATKTDFSCYYEKYGTDNVMSVSSITLEGINELKEKLASICNTSNNRKIISDLVGKGDVAVLVVPIDESAPKGRLILPQQQVIRDLLDVGATALVTKETELEDTLNKLKEKPKVVITDSQAFKFVSEIVPEDIYLTSFSILMARYKGDLDWQVSGVKTIDSLTNGDIVLISEGCTHHRQCGDIGSVKLPRWIKQYTGKEISFEFTSGKEFPDDLSKYKMIIHCGGCTLNEKEMKYRINKAREEGIPITNYGVAISYMNGILERSLSLLTISGK